MCKFVGEKVHLRIFTISLRSVQDPLISTSLPVFDLIDAIAPGAVRWDVVKQVERGMMTEGDKMDNAKYETKCHTCLCFTTSSADPLLNSANHLGSLPGMLSPWPARSVPASTLCRTTWWR